MNLLGSLTKADLDADRLYFPKDEVNEFVCTDFTLDKTKGTIMLRTVVQTNEHKGKKHTIFIPDDSTEMNRKKRAQFFFASGFWTAEEIANNDTTPIALSRLVGRRFSARASKVREKDDKRYQDLNDIKDLGPAPQPASDSPGATAAATTRF